MFKEVKTPINNKCIISKQTINSFTKCFIDLQLINIHIGVNREVNSINGIDIWSNPKCSNPHFNITIFLSVHKSNLLNWKDVLGICDTHILMVTQRAIREELRPNLFISKVLWLGIAQIIKEDSDNIIINPINIYSVGNPCSDHIKLAVTATTAMVIGK